MKDQLNKDNKERGYSHGTSSAPIGGGGELPKGFPVADVPLPSDKTSDIIAGGVSEANSLQTWVVQYKVSSDGAAAYEAKLEAGEFKAVRADPSAENGSDVIYKFESAKYAVSLIDRDTSPPTLLITVGANAATTATTAAA